MTEAGLAAQFRRIGLFASLPDAILQTVIAQSTPRRSAKGSQILSFRDETNDVFFVLDGRLQVKNFSSSGREFIYSEISAGDLFGEFSALDGMPRAASVIAIEDLFVARMKSHDFLSLLRSDFDLTLRLLRVLTGKARGLSDRLLEVIVLSARDRVRFELSRLAMKGVRVGPSVAIRPAPTHYELAARVGSQREAVTRELNWLELSGYLRLSRKEIVIVDIDRFTGDLLADGEETSFAP